MTVPLGTGSLYIDAYTTRLNSSSLNPGDRYFLDDCALMKVFQYPTDATEQTNPIKTFFSNPPSSQTATNGISVSDVMSNIMTKDFYTPPDANDNIVQSILRIVFLFCKRAIQAQIACRIGNIKSTTGCSNTFDSAIMTACDAHLTAIAEAIQGRVPFSDDGASFDRHMTSCKNEIINYISDVSSESSAAMTDAPTSAQPLSMMGTHAYTNAIFNVTSTPTIANLIYYGLSPWLKLLFTATFISKRAPQNFRDMWYGQLVILMTGYQFAMYLGWTVTGLPQTTVAAMQALMTMIATHVNQLSNAQANLDTLYRDAVGAIGDNRFTSSNLTASNQELMFKRKNMEILGTNYIVNKASTRKSYILMCATIAVYASLTIGVSVLIASKQLAPYSLLISGIIMIAIIIYTLVRLFKSK